MIDNKQKNIIKTHIEDKIKGIKKDILSFKKLTQPVPPDNAIGRITRMEAINSKSINEAALGRSEATLRKLERALKIIDEEDFGLCVECEEAIPFARLMIIPETTLCVQCAEKLTG